MWSAIKSTLLRSRGEGVEPLLALDQGGFLDQGAAVLEGLLGLRVYFDQRVVHALAPEEGRRVVDYFGRRHFVESLVPRFEPQGDFRLVHSYPVSGTLLLQDFLFCLY